ncbi:MAG: tRNA lysidine(34) synthetase TilS [Kosmotogaceae bacterium]|nr:tRNA lysidine(34) synthetase TilS [Kosmotogaceae bacterium]
MDSFELEVLRFVEEWGLIRKEQRILVAVSGGKDSMALLNVLNNLKSTLKIELIAANLNHGLREEGPREEARMIESFCRDRSIGFFHEKRDVREYMRMKRGRSVESAAREVRYGFLRDVKASVGADRIALGHNRDDLVENTLLRLLKGTGMKGLIGLRPSNVDLIRPLLFSDMQRIIDYVTINKVTFMEDETNAEDDFERNFLRLRVIPELRKMNPALNKAIWRFFENIYDGYSFIDSRVELLLSRFGKADGIYFAEVSKMRQIERPLIFELVRKIVSTMSLDNYPPSRERVLAFFDLLSEDKGRWTVQFKEDVKASKIGRFVFFYRGTLEFRGQDQSFIESVPFACEGEGWRIRIESKAEMANEDFGELDGAFKSMCSVSRIIFPLSFRKMNDKDKVIPFGMKREKRVVEILSDKGLKGFSSKIMVLENAFGEILWIPGVVTSELCRVGPSSRNNVVFCLERR